MSSGSAWADGYRERLARIPRAVVWMKTGEGLPTLILPDGCMDVIATGDGRLTVAGPDTRGWWSHAPAGTRHVALRFGPGALPPLLGLPAGELRDRRVGLEEVWGRARAGELAERLAGAGDPAAVLECELAAAARRAARPDPAPAAAVAELRRGTPVAAVARELGLSERQLRRRCRDAYGYGPKTLARILRFTAALDHVRTGLAPALAAAESGYADQPHLSRDARELAGVPLGALVP